MKLVCGVLPALALVLAALPCQAYNLTPIYEETEVRLENQGNVPPFLRPVVARVLDQFSDPAHEAVTARMFGCTGEFGECGDNPEQVVPPGVLDGLRWNDNPIFRLSSGSAYCPRARRPDYYLDLDSDPLCWATLFYDAQKRASARPGEHLTGDTGGTPPALLYRVHFGDLQFLHAMASWDGEKAADTQAHVLAWLELTWRIQDGELANLDTQIAAEVPALAPLFRRNGFSPRSLFLPHLAASRPESDAILRGMALGSLLHTLEDSWSAAHTRREAADAGRRCPGFPDAPVPGRILAFNAYNHQDGNLHKQRDTSEAAQAQLQEPSPLDQVGRQVLRMSADKRTWAEAGPYLRCVMEVADPAVAAGPGGFTR